MTTRREIILWQYPKAFDLPSLSPFCVKIEAYLRLRRIPYAVRVTSNPKHGPYGKMPVLQDGARRIADSRLIVAHLDETWPGALEQDLTANERAVGHVLQRTIEEHLYFAIMHMRWVDSQGFTACSREFAAAFPFGLRRLALGWIRLMLKKQCAMQGFGRLDRREAYRLAIADVAAVESLIMGPFLFGERPTSFDACAYAFLQTIARFPVDNPLRERILDSAKLMVYLARMEDACGFGTKES